ncbi:hypothetical protein KY285_007414 [Solanum tuberosum]|nr:hypothetical protein KY285_007414 [Solanum tuberosum]
MPHEAISLYSRLKHVGSSVCDQYTYSSVINACAETKRILVGCLELCVKEMLLHGILFFHEIGDVRVADFLYGLLVKLGNAYVNDLFVVSAAIVFGYIQNNFPFKVVDLFLEAVEAEDAVTTDDVTFVSALMATSQLQHLEFVRQLHACLIMKCRDSQVISLNAMIATYSRCNHVGNSFKVFNGMKEIYIVSWNTMVSALVQNELDNEALMLVYEIQKLWVAIDDITITILLSAASNLRDREIGKQTHAYLLKHNIQFEGMECYLIDMYAKSNMIREERAIFQSNFTYDKDQATWNAMIAGNTQNGLVEQSFVVFKEMLEQNVKPNAVTLASILQSCSQSGSIAIGKQLHCFAIR